MMLAKIFRELELRGEESSDDDADDFPKLVGTTIIMPQKELQDLIANVTVTAQMAGEYSGARQWPLLLALLELLLLQTQHTR